MGPVDRLVLERDLLREANLSSRVIQTIEASRQPSTTTIYNAKWTTFIKWCQVTHMDPTRASVPQILEVLQDGLDRSYSHNTIRRKVAVLSTMLPGDGWQSLAQHPVIKRFIKQAANLNPQ